MKKQFIEAILAEFEEFLTPYRTHGNPKLSDLLTSYAEIGPQDDSDAALDEPNSVWNAIRFFWDRPEEARLHNVAQTMFDSFVRDCGGGMWKLIRKGRIQESECDEGPLKDLFGARAWNRAKLGDEGFFRFWEPPKLGALKRIGEAFKTEASKDEEPVHSSQQQAENSFRKEGEFWNVSFQGEKAGGFADIEGMRYVAYWLARPNEKVSHDEVKQACERRSDLGNRYTEKHPHDERSVSAFGLKTRLGRTPKSRQEDEEQLNELARQISEAEECHDTETKKRLDRAFQKHISERNTGIAEAHDEFKRTHDSVRNNFTPAQEKLRKRLSSFSEHLVTYLEITKDFSRYSPPGNVKWDVKC